ncbi:MAG: hypothetical protein ACP5VS_03165 [Desulfomonilaceae bacterium]
MKKWLLVIVVTFLVASCSFERAVKWIEDIDWERDDQTIKMSHILLR